MQTPRPPTPVMAPWNSYIFVLNFSKISKSNQIKDQSAVHLRTKKSSMPGQLHLSKPIFEQKHYPPQFNILHELQLSITHPLHNVLPPPNQLVNPPTLTPPQQLSNPQPPVIPSSIPASATTYLTVPNSPEQNTVQSPQARLVPCPNAPKLPPNWNPELKLWHFPQNNPPKIMEPFSTSFNRH